MCIYKILLHTNLRVLEIFYGEQPYVQLLVDHLRSHPRCQTHTPDRHLLQSNAQS